jgi:dephospho-CoA kinase
VYLVGLTGGIGSGKTTFAALLAERGAQIIDADLLGRDALRPGRPAWNSVVDTFGDEILVPNTMDIDRKALAEIVFNDRAKLAALNAIVHPVIVAGIADQLERLRNTDSVVILDAALIVELGLGGSLDTTIVVVTDRKEREQRLVRDRGMSIADIGARIAAQATDDDLIAKADVVVRNDGSLERLASEADRVWGLLEERAP